MNDRLKEFKIKNPSGIKFVFPMIFLIMMLMISLNRLDERSFMFYFDLLWIIIGVFGLVATIIRTYKSPSEISFYSTSIEVNGKLINANDIDTIMVYGVKTKVVGIKPKKNIIVPLDFYFQFISSEKKGINYLEEWANVNKIRYQNRFFIKWI